MAEQLAIRRSDLLRHLVLFTALYPSERASITHFKPARTPSAAGPARPAASGTTGYSVTGTS